jgi:hypothetical protein
MKTKTLFSIMLLAIGMIVNAQTVNKKLAKKIAEVEKEAALTKDEGSLGQLHQDNLGKIIFANAEISRDNMKAGVDLKLKNSFNLGESIYGRAFFAKGLNQYPIVRQWNGGFDVKQNNNELFFVSIYSDGVLIFTNGIDKNDYISTFTTSYQVPIIPSSKDGGILPEFTKALNALSPGKHKMKVEFWGGSRRIEYKTIEPVAVGEFELNVGNGAKAKMGVSFDDLEAGMTDKATVDKMLIQVQKIAKNRKEKIVKVKLKYDDWFIHRNKTTGIILGRIQLVYVYAEWPDGHCSYEEWEMEQAYDGSKYSGDFYQAGLSGLRTCDCLDK